MSREEVIRRIVERDVQEQALTEKAVVAEAPDLHHLACEQFGTWDTALKYAGVSLRRLRAEQGYTPKRVIEAIGRLCRKGSNLRANTMMRRDRRLYDAARRHFGSWRRALEAAGIVVQRAGLRDKPRGRIDKPKILEALRQRHQAGHSLVWGDICLEDRSLACRAKYAFNGWRQALMAAGIPTELRLLANRPRWDQQRIIDAIRLRQQEGKPLNFRKVCRENRGLYSAVQKYFGSWTQALLAAGVEPIKRVRRGRGK